MFKRIVLKCFSIFVLFFGSIATAEIRKFANPQPLAPPDVVNKLSYTITGKPAPSKVIGKFREDLETHPEKFNELYDALITSFMKDRSYKDILKKFHETWWRIDFGNVSDHAAFVVTSGRPYSEVFHRRYIYTDGSFAKVYQKLNIRTKTDLPTEQGLPEIVPLADEEHRFGGLFGSPEFLFVYPDTNSNFNRKRSSQVFRLAFCETLTNNLENDEGVPIPPNFSLDAPHGSSPDCFGCHRRLDPVARFFDQWRPPSVPDFFAEYDEFKTANGLVLLGGKSGMLRQIAGTGDGDLGKIVVTQPEYKSCMAKMGWQFVFGRKALIENAYLQNLTAEFSKTDRFNDVIRLALKHPYFWSREEPPPLVFSDIKHHLKDCSSCHREGYSTQFDSDQYPFKGEATENFALLQRIWDAINYQNGRRPMPESPRPKLSAEALDDIRNWILAGARDSQNKESLSATQIEEILE